MGSEIQVTEARLYSFLEQFQVECEIFERIVHKTKNQHRRCSYFQYLLKVRRDLRLLKSAKLEELVGSCVQVITGNKPKAKVHLLESLKWRKRDCGKPNFMERLLGAARLLSEMVEPMLKAASKVSALLAQTFFMGFSLTVLAMLARLRVLIQQMLLDVVSIFNMVSPLSQVKHSVKINLNGIEVIRDCYPANAEFVILECVWKTDKFVLIERIHKPDTKGQDGGGDVSFASSALLYETVESFLGDLDSDFEKACKEYTVEKVSTQPMENDKDLSAGSSIVSEPREQTDGSAEVGGNPVVAGSPDEELQARNDLHTTSSSSSSVQLGRKSTPGPLGFISVKRTAPSTTAFVSVKKPATVNDNPKDHLKGIHRDN